MTQLSKDQLRKIHGVTEPTGPEDPTVIARRKFHEAAAKWLARWSYPLQGLFASIGLVVVLLPTMSKSWRSVVEMMPIAGRIFQDFSSLSGSAMLLFYFLSGLFVIQTRVQSKNPAGQASFLTYRDVVEMELYPKNKGEELAYWVDFSLAVTGTTLWLYLPFGILAFAIRMGG
ncbi:hypothetical protein [Rhodocyclus tenuis]|uniref:hypothetical protein n=1 Tax=Rhodocyclus tenuis TaxID=1066 RepID=UPI001906A0D3|nr:hypothetical protein [Rhodocyclus tenuis]